MHRVAPQLESLIPGRDPVAIDDVLGAMSVLSKKEAPS